MSKTEIRKLEKEQEKMQAELDRQSDRISEMQWPYTYQCHVRYLNETVELLMQLAVLRQELAILLDKGDEESFCMFHHIDLKNKENEIDNLIIKIYYRNQEKYEPHSRTHFLRCFT